LNILRCPVCKNDLVREIKRFVCANNHSFDIAKQGYVNLLLSSQMASKHPGDSAQMIADRHAFLENGFYAPLRDRILVELAQLQIPARAQAVLDLGCGEGYYTAAFAAENRTVYGLDIAKPALAMAAKRAASITWCVGTNRALPFHDASFDVVTTIFCRPQSDETRRVLREDGVLLLIGPGPNHLRELRDIVYAQVNEDIAETALAGFALSRCETLSYSMTLDGAAIMQLARMTPHYWRAPQERRGQLENTKKLTLQVEFQLSIWQKN
jgi:23S rRNA (guanine745-N1)-methyltransferase